MQVPLFIYIWRMTRDEQLEIVRSSVMLGTWFGHSKWEYGGTESDEQDDYYLYDFFVVRPAMIRENLIWSTGSPPRLPRGMRMPPSMRLRIDFFVSGQVERVCSRSFDADLLDKLGLSLNRSYSIDRLLSMFEVSSRNKIRRTIRSGK